MIPLCWQEKSNNQIAQQGNSGRNTQVKTSHTILNLEKTTNTNKNKNLGNNYTKNKISKQVQ